MFTIYNKLLKLPLFIGIGSNEVKNIVGLTKFGFHKREAGHLLVAEDERCTKLYFLMSGSLRVISHADNHSYQIEEEVSAPTVIQPEHFFGMVPHYTKDFVAKTDCSLLSLTKAELMRLMDTYIIIRLNFLNILSIRAQRMERLPWRTIPDNIQQQFLFFLRQRCLTPVGRKILRMKMDDLGKALHQSRQNVSIMLNNLQEMGLLTVGRGIITIEHLESIDAAVYRKEQ